MGDVIYERFLSVLVSGSEDCTVRIWDLEDDKPITPLPPTEENKSRLTTATSTKSRLATATSTKSRLATAASSKSRLATATSTKSRLSTSATREAFTIYVNQILLLFTPYYQYLKFTLASLSPNRFGHRSECYITGRLTQAEKQHLNRWPLLMRAFLVFNYLK